MTNLISDKCNSCGKDVAVTGYYPEVGCVCSRDCYKTLIVPIRLRQAGLDKGLYAEMRLDSYEFEDGSLKESLYHYLEHPDPNGWAFFGEIGTGKTHLAVGMARAMVERYMLKAEIISTPELMASLYDNMKVDGRISTLMEHYKEIDLLVLDDLGAEKSSDYAVQQLFLVIDHRLRNKKLTFITSNYSINDMSKYVSQRIASRILQLCRIIIIPGGDYRLNKQKEGT